MPHIQGDDLSGSPAQKHVAEAAGRGADVQAAQAARRRQASTGELVEGANQLVRAARHVVVALVDGDRGRGGHVRGRFGDGDTVDQHMAVTDQPLCLGAARHQSQTDDERIKTFHSCTFHIRRAVGNVR